VPSNARQALSPHEKHQIEHPPHDGGAPCQLIALRRLDSLSWIPYPGFHAERCSALREYSGPVFPRHGPRIALRCIRATCLRVS